jgi:hypothetical protein
MKRLTEVAAIALLGAVIAQPVGATTVFCTNCTEEVSEAARQIETLQQWASQLKSMADQLKQLTDVNAVLSHVTSLSGISGSVGGLTHQVMPSSSQITGLMNGTSTWGTANTRLNDNRLYAPSQSDEWSEEMKRRETVTANAQAIVDAVYKDTETQLSKLDELKAQVEAAPDLTAVTAQSAGIALAQQRLTANAAMLQQAQLLLAADNRVTQQRAEQRWRRDVDAWAEKTKSALEGW